MRYEFGKVIAELAARDKRIHLLIGDTGYKMFPDFLRQFPLSKNPLEDRLHNFGVSEQSMIGIAGGMAIEGLQPWVFAITPFLIERPFEQVKIAVDSQNVPVKLVGYCDYPEEGPTHELITPRLADVFTNIRGFYPTSAAETRRAVLEAYHHPGPTFISLKKDRERI